MTSPGARGTASQCRKPAFHQLNIFLTVESAGSFTAAGRRLGISQAAVSQSIRRLEEILGGDLIERSSGHPLALTPIGRAILPSVQAIIGAVDRQIIWAADAAQGRLGQLTLGVSCGFFPVVGMAITLHRKRAPGVVITLVEDEPHMLLERLRRRAVDLIVIPDLSPQYDGDLDRKILCEERLLAGIASGNAEIAEAGLVTWDALVGVNLTLHGATAALLQTLASPRVLRSQSHAVPPETLFDLIAATRGVTVVAASHLRQHAGINFRPIEEDNAKIALHAMWLREDRNSVRHSLLRTLERVISETNKPS